MSDECKIKIVRQMIQNYYEFLFSDDSVCNSATLEALISDIDVVLGYEPENAKACSCSGECHNCLE